MSDLFPTTQWTEFFALRDSSDPASRKLALAHLYERYWSPLYAYLRRRGFDQDQSADLLQDFFAHLLEREIVARLDLSGKLRAFLLAMLKHHVSDQLDKARTLKRNSGRELLSLDVEAAERTYREVRSSEMSPDEVYERRWALEMMQRAQKRLEKSEANSGRADAFSHLSECVYGDAGPSSYGEIAGVLGLTEVATKVRVHRLRKRFGRLLREDIALTVAGAASVDEELRHLLSLME